MAEPVESLAVVAQFEERFGRAAALARANLFMIAYLSLSWNAISPLAQEAVGIAKRFSDGEASHDDLVAMRVRCWEYLGPGEEERKKPDVTAIRAAICMLYGGGVEDTPADFLLDFFLSLADKIEDHSDQLDLLLEIYFS